MIRTYGTALRAETRCYVTCVEFAARSLLCDITTVDLCMMATSVESFSDNNRGTGPLNIYSLWLWAKFIKFEPENCPVPIDASRKVK